jgi:arylsulfatase A-like enzyme
MTDVLTGEARRFIADNASRPFCLYLSHKAVHYPFEPPKRHVGLFEGLRPTYPQSMIFKEENYQQWPEWVRKRRYTRHGVDGMFGSTGFFDEFYRGYLQCLKSVDESVGEILGQLEDRKLLDDTLVIYMGDNGYMWGEHGLIDKRAMLEPSIRVPMMAHCPGMFQGGRTVDAMALNLDIAPTLLDIAGIKTPGTMHGASLVPLLDGRTPENWRNDFVYEYEWEQDYPYTPTITGLRTTQHSLAQFYGIWDVPELYDIRKDTEQMRNLLSPYRITSGRGRYTTLIQDAELRALVTGMQKRLAEILQTTGGDPRLAGLGSEGDKFAL